MNELYEIIEFRVKFEYRDTTCTMSIWAGDPDSVIDGMLEGLEEDSPPMKILSVRRAHEAR